MPTPNPEHRRAARTAVRVAVVVIGVALLAVMALVLFKPAWIASAMKGQIEEIATKSMGRPVTIGAIDARLFPRPGATITSFKVEGGPGEPPLVEANSARATAKLWPLIRSLGKEVRIDELVLESATVTLLRRENGTWNYEDIQSSDESGSDREVFIDTIALKGSEVRLIDQQAKGGDATIALQQIDLEVHDVGPGQTIGIEGKAALASTAQNVSVDLDVESPMGKPEGYFPKVEGTLQMNGVRVSAFKLFLPSKAASLFSGGIAEGKMKLSTTEAKHYTVDGGLDVDKLRLRGEPAEGQLHFTSTIDPANATAARVNIDRMSVKGPGVDLGGNATVRMKPLAMEFAVKGPLLDLGELLAVLPEEPEDEEIAKKELMPASMREELGEMTVKGTLQIDEVRRGKLVAKSLNARGKLDDGVFALETGTAQVFGGVANLAGTRVDLKPAQPEWSLRAKVQGLDVAQAFSQMSGHQALAGKAALDITLDGEGTDWATVSKAMSGDGMLELADGALTSVDLADKLAPAIAAGLVKLGHSGAAGTVEKVGQGTQLQDLKTAFSIRDGFLKLNRPLQFRSNIGTFELGGRIALDQRMDLDGKATASPQFVSRVSNGMLKTSLPVPLAVDGTLLHPDVKPGSPGNIARSLARNPPEPVKREVDKAKKTATEKAKKGLEDALDRFRRP